MGLIRKFEIGIAKQQKFLIDSKFQFKFRIAAERKIHSNLRVKKHSQLETAN
jgi:hypothetical protein